MGPNGAGDLNVEGDWEGAINLQGIIGIQSWEEEFANMKMNSTKTGTLTINLPRTLRSKNTTGSLRRRDCDKAG